MRFTDKALERIANAVRRVERMPVTDQPLDEGSAAPSHLRKCGKLDADLDCNNAAATATCSIWSSHGGAWADTGVNVTVRPPWARALGKILSGMKVEIEYDLSAGGWIVVSGGKARKIRATADADFETTDDVVAATVVDWFDGEDPDPADAGLNLANDGNVFEGEEDNYLFAEYDPEADEYRLYQVECTPPGS